MMYGSFLLLPVLYASGVAAQSGVVYAFEAALGLFLVPGAGAMLYARFLRRYGEDSEYRVVLRSGAFLLALGGLGVSSLFQTSIWPSLLLSCAVFAGLFMVGSVLRTRDVLAK